MPIQTSVSFGMSAAALKGQMLSRPVNYISTCYSAAQTEFGVGLVYDSAVLDGDTKKVKVPTAIDQDFVGVSILTGKENKGDPDFLTVVTSTQDAKFDIGEPFPVLERGFIWVYSEEAVDVTDPVYLRCVTVSALLAGNFRKSDGEVSSVAKAVLLPNAKWANKTAAAGLALLQLL